MARKATEEQKAAELKNKLQTVKKSLEEQQHRNNRSSKQLNSTRPLQKPGRLQRRKPQLRHAAKEVAERETEARQQTRQKALAKTAAEAGNASRRTVFGTTTADNMPNELLVI